MSCSLSEEKLAADSGYVLLMRYNQETNMINLDSKEPNFKKYDEFLMNEVRYRSLKLNKEAAINRYNYYKDLVSEQKTELK